MKTTAAIRGTRSPANLPRSACHPLIPISGLLGMVLGSLAIVELKPSDRAISLVLLLASTALPMLVLEARARHLDWRRAASGDRERILIKLYGLGTTLALIALGYWALPVYRGAQLEALLALLNVLAVPLLILSPLYVWLTDRTMDAPCDGLYMAGLTVVGRIAEVDKRELVQFALGWLVKAFFLPLMLWAVWDGIGLLYSVPSLRSALLEGYGWFDVPYRIIFFVDMTFASIGYMCTLRLLGTHIRRTDPTLKGWAVCLLCYFPFAEALSPYFFAYQVTGRTWTYWLGHFPVLETAWGATILLLGLVHLWANVSFGLRFSNLTHRGIITSGPYRWSKHPAYVTKVLMWWMIWLPFVNSDSWTEALRNSLILFLLTYVYYLRAKTEEANLLFDADYRAYAAAIDRHGLLARLRRAASGLRGGSSHQA